MATSKTKQATAKKPPKKKLQRVKEGKSKSEEDFKEMLCLFMVPVTTGFGASLMLHMNVGFV
jgi:hypothetical protein